MHDDYVKVKKRNLDMSRTDWFTNARFGMFIHWGIYAIPAAGEWIFANLKDAIVIHCRISYAQIKDFRHL